MHLIRNFFFRLKREPGFAAIFIITLALGVGANAALLSALRGYYLAPLPYPDAGRLVNIQQDFQGLGGISIGSYHDVLSNTKGISDGALAGTERITISGNNQPRSVVVATVTPSLFPTLGVAPAVGRTLKTSSGQPDGPREAVLSYQFWKTAYAGATDAVGKTINIDGQTYNIVGVMPQGFYFPNRRTRVYLPLPIAATDAHDYLHVSSWDFIARIAPHANLAALNTALKAQAQTEIGNLKPIERKMAEKQGYLLKAETLRTTLVGHSGTRLSLIECGAALLFALAVAILANLVTTRSLGRRHEHALKLALGANRTILWRDALRETLPLAMLGAGGAILLAWAGIGLLLRYGFGGADSAFEVSLNGWTVLISILLALAAGLLAALPAAFGSGSRLLARLVEDGGHGTPTRQSRYLQRGLSITQIALGVALLANAALIGVAYHQLSSRSNGFESSHLIVASLGLREQRFSKQATNVAFVRQFASAAEKLPGFQSVGIANAIPFGDTIVVNNVHRSGAPTDQQIYPAFSYGTQSLLKTLGVHLAAGQTFSAQDINGHAMVAIIDADLSRALFPSPQAAIGQTIVARGKTLRVIGVTNYVRWFPHPFGNLTGTLWLPYSMLPGSDTADGVYVTVKTSLPTPVAVRELKDLLSRLAPDQAFNWVRPMHALTANAYQGDQAPAVLVGLFSLIALTLAAIGVYGTVAYLIRLRLGEFAVRQAVGATPGRIGFLALTQGALLAIAGIALGIGGGFLLSRFLFNSIAINPSATTAVYAVTALAMVFIVFVTTSIPAQRARRANLLSLLRPQ